MEDYRKRFQELLQQLFQFESADLDFGIYRIMNYKRSVIEKFIEKDLIKAVSAELDTGALAEQSEVAKQLQEVAEQIRENLGEDAIDGDDNLDPRNHETPIGKKYLDLQARARGAHARPALDATVFNHLYSFFSRYYDAGDFMSKRRYSKREKYAVPYNGEEVYLHWANKDQYYIKTGEYFKDYRFQAPNDVAVHFRLLAAQVEQDNVKGDKRFFIPLTKKAAFEAKEVVILFEYRALSEQEGIRYGQRKQQDTIIAEALEAIPGHFTKEGAALAALMAERRKNADGQPVSYLEHHLRQYTRRNTSDFFIHKDLKGFLERELDFYLKNEVLNLDELEAGGETRAEGWFQLMMAIKAIGTKIIAFLTQIENFQKKLFEKRKFVLETHYCITGGNIPEAFYAEIAANDAQWEEWKDLFHIDEEEENLFAAAAKRRKDRRVAFLRAHPTLVVDTKHFNAGFVDRVLASFDNLDGATDGLLFQAENFQALNLLLEKFRERIKCIYIDPPYNTGTGDFVYKDSYQHSSWMTMMYSRIMLARQLLRPDGHLISHIDEHEVNALEKLIRLGFGSRNSIGPVIWDKRNPKGDATGIATQHEYLLWSIAESDTLKTEGGLHRKKKNADTILRKAGELVERAGRVNDKIRGEFKKWLQAQPFSEGEKAYSEIDQEGNVYRAVSMAWPNKKRAPDDYFTPIIHPVKNKSCPVPKRGWRYPSSTLRDLVSQGMVLFGPDESTIPNRKYTLKDNLMENIPSLLYYGASDDVLQDNMGFFFENPKPVAVGEYVVAVTTPGRDQLVLDFFAGSGTAGHAVINLNRADGMGRKFILVEMGHFFDSVLLSRVKKVTFTPEWKDGSPARRATPQETGRDPRIIKYVRLESYEDALDNIAFDEQADQKALQFDDYLLNYMLDWETKDSDTFLNVEKLASPFDYRLRVTQDWHSAQKPADLPETFNYLLGLHVKTRKVYQDKDSNSHFGLVSQRGPGETDGC